MHAKRQRLLLSTAALMGALTGYGRSAYAQCAGAAPNFTCSGINTDEQSINGINNATVTTVDGFSVNVDDPPGGNAIFISGDGTISYTDDYGSPLTSSGADTDALFIQSESDIAPGDGSVTARTNGNLIGVDDGIDARNYGSGATSITATGSVTGNGADGISASNGTIAIQAGTDLSVTTGDGAILGAVQGIRTLNNGTGGTTVTTGAGDVTGTGAAGIFARQLLGSAGDIVVNTGSGTVYGGYRGITANTSGTGGVSITTSGNVAGGTDGLRAFGFDAALGDMTVNTGAGTITGARRAVEALSQGSGDVTVTTSSGAITASGIGVATNDSYGIRAFSRDNTGVGGDVVVTTGSGDVSGRDGGIVARSRSDTGNVTVTTGSGDIAGGNGVNSDGIFARKEDFIGGVPSSGDVTVTTGSGDIVGGTRGGIFADHFGTGGNVTVNTGSGTVTGGDGGHGIFARLATAGTGDLEVTTGTGAVMGGNGIVGAQRGSGALNVTVNGDVTGNTNDGIDAQNSASATDINVTTAANTIVRGDDIGILARNAGSGEINIIVDGDVIGTRNDGINARHSGGGAINITVGTRATVTSNGGDAIPDFAIDTFEGPADVTVAGTLNGGGGGAVRFDGLDDRLELRTTAVVNGNVLARGGSDTLAFAGAGNGTFNLNNIDDGTNTRQYQDFEDFIVESATWTMNGVTAADFLVVGGTLKGNGTFGDLTVNNGGTLSPGNSFGTMTVNGVFSLNAGSVFEVEVNANNQGDLVVVNGTVNLTGATLRILAAPGDYKLETEYVIIDNDGTDAVNGVFGAITSTLAFLIPTVAYDGGTGNDVVLRLRRNGVDTCDIADTDNQSAACGAIDEDNPLFDIILGQTVEGARQAFDALSGEVHASAAGVMADDNRYVREAILGRMMQASHGGEALSAGGPQVAALDAGAYALGYDGKSLAEPERAPLAFWTSAYGAWGTYDGDGNAATANRDLGGFMSGMDADIGGSWRAGLTTGASFSSIDVDDRFSNADVESYYLGGYLGGMAGSFALRSGGTWAWSDIDTSRAVIFPGFFERQKASYDADTGQIFGEVAYPTQMGGIALEPFGGIAYVSLDTDTFTERGGPLASLRGRGSGQDVGYTTLGLRAATTMQWGAMMVVPHVSARWQHAFDDVTPSAALAFATTGAGFVVEGVPLAEDSALLDAGLDFAVSDRVSAGVSYSGQYADTVVDNAVKGRFTWQF